jgi:hypothetical protein
VIDDTVHDNLSEWRLFLIFSGKIAVVLDFLTLRFRNIKKARPRRAFWPVSQRFQINVIFTDNVDNVRILCLFCKVKKSKTTAILPENIRNKRHSDKLSWTVSSITIALILVQFLFFFYVSKARRNKCYICRQCMYIVYIFITRKSQYFTDIYVIRTAYPSGESEFTYCFNGVRAAQSLILCIICLSPIYGFIKLL